MKMTLVMKLLVLVLTLLTFSTQVSQVQSQNRIYKVTVSALPSTGGTAIGGGNFKVNTRVTVSAVPSSGYSFVNWTVPNGDVISTSQSFTFTLVGNAYLTANFITNPVQPPCSCGPPS